MGGAKPYNRKILLCTWLGVLIEPLWKLALTGKGQIGVFFSQDLPPLPCSHCSLTQGSRLFLSVGLSQTVLLIKELVPKVAQIL